MRSRNPFSSAALGPPTSGWPSLRRLAPLLAPALLVAALGCGDDAQSPTAPEPEPALAAGAAQALSFRQVSAGGGLSGDLHACGVTTDDRAYCWGANLWGQLGIGTSTGPEDCGNPCSTRPVAVLGGLRFRHVSAGDRFTCGITTDDRAYCWGRNFEGQLGDGTQTGRPRPEPVAGTRRFRQVRAGANHACAINLFDVAFCWGWNGEGELGDGTTTQRLTPVRVAGGLSWRLLSGDFVHTCGVTTANRAYCWGWNATGALGDGTTTRRLRPVPVSGGLPFRQIDAGSFYTCGVTTGDVAYCWGLNSTGQLGDASKNSHPTPTLVFGRLRRYDHVSAGGGHTCGVTRAGRGFCWGNNLSGQLGTGTTAFRLTPTALGVDLSLAQVSAGYISTCSVTTDHRAYCWGDNSDGQLGDGTTTRRLTPVPVAGGN
jgi:alpha-tubulin suppressor-like RCC1 family protein